jgi:hypothetical protein
LVAIEDDQDPTKALIINLPYENPGTSEEEKEARVVIGQ